MIAACDSVPIFPSQNVSVKLYIDWIKLFIMTGMASIKIACIRFPLRIILRLSALKGFDISPSFVLKT